MRIGDLTKHWRHEEHIMFANIERPFHYLVVNIHPGGITTYAFYEDNHEIGSLNIFLATQLVIVGRLTVEEMLTFPMECVRLAACE